MLAMNAAQAQSDAEDDPQHQPTTSLLDDSLVDTDSQTNPFDHLFEHTHFHSVEAAAVRVPADETPTHSPEVVMKPEQGESVTLEFSDGSTATLDQPLLIGRRPSAPSSLDGRPYQLITLSGSGSGLSRTHVRIDPDSEGALVTDLGSTNGTVLLSSDEVITLQPHEPQPALPGDRILLSENVEIRLTRSE